MKSKDEKYESIQDFLLEYVKDSKGTVDYALLTDKLRQCFPKSKWNEAHWTQYRKRLINGEIGNLDKGVRDNLVKSTHRISRPPKMKLSKREVETKAIELVKQWLKLQDIDSWECTDNKGYDLETSDEQWIEVKGRSGNSGPVMVYESVFEKNNAQELREKYRIYVVNNVGSQPELIVINPSDDIWSETKIRVLKTNALKGIQPIPL